MQVKYMFVPALSHCKVQSSRPADPLEENMSMTVLLSQAMQSRMYEGAVPEKMMMMKE